MKAAKLLYLPRPMEFHVAARQRDFFQFDLGLFSSNGNVVFADFTAARRFANAMIAKGRLVSVGQVAAMGLIDEMLHYVVEQYRVNQKPSVMNEALQRLESAFGSDLDQALRSFAQEFPAIKVYRGEQKLEDYLNDSSGGRSNREIVLEEMLMLWLANTNPAFAPFIELFDDVNLEQFTAYLPIINGLETFFEEQPAFAETGMSLFKSLRLPAEMFGDSLEAQLQFLLKRFGGTLGRFMQRLLVNLDVVREEGRRFDVSISIGNEGAGGVSAAAFDFKNQQATLVVPEPENFSPDLEWMPNCVLLAKNAFVWLDQLSKKYQREIRTLDQIPDAELDELQRWGVTGLWLIGLWERSTASKTIKQRMGNSDAVASAYSLYDYQVAGDLGGTDAVEVLRRKAWARGIRLASDMVPNHVGIDGRWVMEHPDWFVGLPYPPYPAYTFNSEDLSSDPKVGIFLEDHYYDKTDAAVVFKRLDRLTGSESYIYHGNDGTAMPWNDTAQLNYLKAEVREAVIQTILHVARQFPIIRFDAAMTLAKRHIQRLWFPPPGGSSWGNSIPSRAEHSLTQEQFDALIPEEFWREVVDRCAAEVPGTLLLAEAFWMMEGFFVRTLGMHRVYNSAFMVMLRDEKNGEYRTVLKNTVEFEPEILKRYVNFLNNPDEKTAEKQFGKGEKYFGVMTLCATLPGLPMLGHGQVEGFTEQYGMEYRRAYYDETPDHGLVDYHHQQIFPLLKRRSLFAESENFVLYDVYSSEGPVNENVFAYSNRSETERALIVFHNAASFMRGWISLSVAQPVKVGAGRELRQRHLGEGLGLSFDGNSWAIFRDQVTGLEYIRNSRELHEKGLYIELGEYKRMVLLDWREVYDFDGTYARIAHMLNGSGSPNVEDARRQLWLEPVLTPFRELVNAGILQRLLDSRSARGKPNKALMDEIETKYVKVASAVQQFNSSTHKTDLKAFRKKLEKTLQLPALVDGLEPKPIKTDKAGNVDYLRSRASAHIGIWGVALGWLFTHELGSSPEQSAAQVDDLLFGRVLSETAQGMGLDSYTANRSSQLVKLLIAQQENLTDAAPKGKNVNKLLNYWVQSAEVQRYLQVNRFEDVVYFNKESFEALLSSFVRLTAVNSHSQQTLAEAKENTAEWYKVLSAYRLDARRAGYRLEDLVETKKPSASRTPKAPKVPKPPTKKGSPKTEPSKAASKTARKAKAVEQPTEAAGTSKTRKKAAPKTAPIVPDDLTLIEGIGPKMAAALEAAQILTYTQLSQSSEEELRKAIEAAGLRFAPSLPTWAKQAVYLAKGDKAGFEKYTKKLVAGRAKK